MNEKADNLTQISKRPGANRSGIRAIEIQKIDQKAG
jgi:hypothetical protein